MTIRPLGEPARHLGVVGSTMDEAARWAAEGAPHGALVVAEDQRAGRGRFGRPWASAPGQSLLFTLVLRPDVAPDRAGLVPLAAGLAVAEAAEAFGADARVKWPNDVLVGGRKLAGVLVVSQWAHGRAQMLLGVGLNVDQSQFSGELAERATSLRLETGRPTHRLELLRPTLDRLAEYLALVEADPAALRAAVQARMVGVGEAVSIRAVGSDAPAHQGAIVGLAPSGALRLATLGGEVTVVAGEVTLS